MSYWSNFFNVSFCANARVNNIVRVYSAAWGMYITKPITFNVAKALIARIWPVLEEYCWHYDQSHHGMHTAHVADWLRETYNMAVEPYRS